MARQPKLLSWIAVNGTILLPVAAIIAAFRITMVSPVPWNLCRRSLHDWVQAFVWQK